MGRRFATREQGGARHAVLVAHPARPDARPCELAFDRRGVILWAGGSAPVLRIPWWALQGLCADTTAPNPGGEVVQVVQLVTDAGVLSLLLPATAVSAMLASLGAWTPRWRGSRRWLDRHVERVVAYAGSLGRVAWRAGQERLAAASRSLPAPVRRIAGPLTRPRAVAAALSAAALSLATWGGVALSATPTTFGTLSAASGPLGAAFDASGMAQILQAAEFQAGAAAHLVRATAPPPPAPASVADATPLTSHEVFGFAPYWALPQEATFDVSGFTTLAYFAVGVNANGTLDESGTGWDGYESQDLVDLVARAHAAGDRVVLTVNCFSQSALNALTSSPSAAATLAAAVVHAVSAKNLDGVNLDFEGQGSADQSGLTAVAATVSSAMHAANPHYQVTMDTYASSAADPGGFYNVPALSKVVDGLFVMAYETNLASTQSSASPITSAEYANATAAAQYAAAATPSKVIFGVPYFGYVWPTTNGTLGATAMGTGTPITYSQVMASGDPVYWDPVTDSAWTSYEVGHQWYEAYVDDPASVYMVAELAQRDGFAGVGAWALGMDGNSPQMTAALDGNAPPERAGPAGPAATSTSAGAGSAPAITVPSAPDRPVVAGGQGSPSPPNVPPAKGGGTAAPGGGAGGSGTGTGSTSASAAGVWDGQPVTLTLQATAAPSGTGTLLGTLTGFTSSDPALACLARTPSGIAVWHYPGAGTDLAIARQPTNCMDAEFTFSAPSSSTTPPGGATAGSAGSATAGSATAGGAGSTSSAASGSAGSAAVSNGTASAPSAVRTPAG